MRRSSGETGKGKDFENNEGGGQSFLLVGDWETELRVTLRASARDRNSRKYLQKAGRGKKSPV